MYNMYLYFFIINISFTTLYVHELCELSNLNYLMYTLISFLAQYFLHKMHVGINDAMQFVFVDFSSDRFSARISRRRRMSLEFVAL